MSRDNKPKIRKIDADPKYSHVTVAKFINCMMERGKKSLSRNIFYDAIGKLAEELKGVNNVENGVEIFDQIIANVRPEIEVRSKRVGGSNYQVPIAVGSRRAIALAIRWLINAARARKDATTMSEKLFKEFKDAYSGKGTAVKKRDETHKVAESNKAFMHFS